jgi:hypothetical protein
MKTFISGFLFGAIAAYLYGKTVTVGQLFVLGFFGFGLLIGRVTAMKKILG